MKTSAKILLITLVSYLVLMVVLVFAAKKFIDRHLEKASGSITTKEYFPSEFERISITGGFDVVLEQGSKYSVSVTVDETFQKHIKVWVKENTLNITGANMMQAFHAKVRIVAPSIHAVNLTAGASLVSENDIRSDNFSLNLSLGSSAEINGIFDSLSCEAIGGSQVMFNGSAAKSVFHLSAGATVKAREFYVDTCIVSAYSGSEILITVNKYLDAEASSGSVIQYLGTPEIGKHSTVSG